VLAPLAQSSSMPPAFPKEAQHHYASWLPGTQDFLIEPLPINDGVHTVSKISALWGIPDAAEMARTGMPHAMLGFTGSTTSFRHFLRGFVDLAGTSNATWPDEKLDPLEEYVLSLRAPKNPSPPPAADVEKGRALFSSKGCISCHAGANASGQRIFTFDEIGTDRAMQQWGDVKVYSGGDQKTGGIKAPRLNGSWAMGRFLHNGSVPTLEGVFCKEGPRGTITEQPFGDMGHDFTCNLAADEKTALIAYLRAN